LRLRPYLKKLKEGINAGFPSDRKSTIGEFCPLKSKKQALSFAIIKV
jgi:hypothetical protein